MYEKYNYGNVAFYDQEEQKIVISSVDDGVAEKFPPTRYTPIGIVVIPVSHSRVVYDVGSPCYGKTIIASFAKMYCSDPDVGTLLDPVDGRYTITGDLSKCGYRSTPYVSIIENNSPNEQASGYVSTSSGEGWIPTDYDFGTVFCEDNTDLSYYINDSSNKFCPTPILGSKSPNPTFYTNLREEINNGYIMANSDFQGREHTDAILTKVTTDESWKTSDTIENIYRDGHYPAAMCCWRYHTPGTSQGDWYFPSFGELAYLATYWKKFVDIFETFNNNGYFNSTIQDTSSRKLSSSINVSGSIYISRTGQIDSVSYNHTNSQYNIFAFCAI